MMESLANGEPVSKQIEWIVLSPQFRQKRGFEQDEKLQQAAHP